MKTRSTAICFGLCLLVVATAASDDASDREKHMDSAARQLQGVVRELGRVASDDSPHNVEKILDEIDDVEDDVEDVERVGSGDLEAEEFVDTYTENLKEIGRPLRTLEEMENIQTSIDGLPATCKAAGAKLEDQIEALVRVPEEDDEEEILKIAAKTGEAIDATLERADRLESDLKRKNSQVGRVSFSERDWREVGRALDRAGDDILRYYQQSLDAAYRACDPLAEPEELDYVTAALALVRASYDAAERFLEDGEEWFVNTREVFKVNCDGLDNVRVAYCAVDFGPHENGEIAAKQNAWPIIIEEVKEVLGMLDPLLERYEALKKTGEHIKRTTGNDEVTRLLSNMGKRYRGLMAIRNGDLLKGSRNPWLQTWQYYGVKQHEAMTSHFGCDVADAPIPGSNKRPDCLVVDDCKIVEFKPDAPGAKRQGDDQLDTYRALLEDYFEELLEDASEEAGWAVPANSYGGGKVLEKLIGAGCVSANRETVTLKTALATYDRCDRLVPTCPEP